MPWAADLETGAARDNVFTRTTAHQPGTCNADVAQLVAHHLAKVRVASSSLVIRSKTSTSLDGLDNYISAISSVGERFPDTEEVTGSIPVSRTRTLS